MQVGIQPEATCAALFAKHNQYSFLIGTSQVGVTYEKKWSSQIDTSIRLLYPILGGRWYKGALAIILLLFLNLPSLFIINGILHGWTIVHIAAVWQLSVFVAIYGLYLGTVWKYGWWFGALLWPYVVAQELTLLVFSMNSYARHIVTWKGRAVTTSSSQVK
jgi:hypothetical protein